MADRPGLVLRPRCVRPALSRGVRSVRHAAFSRYTRARAVDGGPVKVANMLLLAGLAATAVADAAQKSVAKGAAGGVSPAALIAAAKNAMLSQVNYGRELCDGDRNIETWIKDVTGEAAGRIEWRGGACRLTNELNPLDAGSDWRGGATIIPKGHPKEPAAIEIYFEKPVNGKPGKAYAFRAVNYDVDGLDYKRDWPSFEYGYRQKYERGFKMPEAEDCD